MDLISRPRRLRKNEPLRKMIRETRMDKSSLIYPIFVKEGTNIQEEIPSMEGQYRYSVDRLPYELERLAKVIDKIRQTLSTVIDEKQNLLDAEVIAISQKLDDALNKYNNLLEKK